LHVCLRDGENYVYNPLNIIYHPGVHKVDSAEATTSSLAPQLTKAEMELRDRFVAEYMTDYDHYKAAIRIGYAPAYAKDFGQRFMNEPYVLRKIKDAEGGTTDDLDVEAQKKMIVAALWREAKNMGVGSSQAARVAALAKLSAFYGMDAPKTSKTELTGADGLPLGSGVFVVPGMVTAEEWAKQAEAQQEELIRPSPPPVLRVA
jgi:hypothetical protein